MLKTKKPYDLGASHHITLLEYILKEIHRNALFTERKKALSRTIELSVNTTLHIRLEPGTGAAT